PRDCGCFPWIATDWLFAKYVFACVGRCLSDLQVQVIGRGDVDHRDFRIVNDLPPISGIALEPEPLLGVAGTRLHLVGTHDQTCQESAFVEAVGNHPVRAAVHQSHPAHADDADADWFIHSPRLALSSWSVQKCRMSNKE